MKVLLSRKKPYNKFKNDKVKNILGAFDSKLEYKHYLLLKAKEQKGEISHLARQVRIKLGKAKECKVYYIADFVFFDNLANIWVVMDSKGVETDTFKIKLKWLLDSYSNFRFDLAFNGGLRTYYPYTENNPHLIALNKN